MDNILEQIQSLTDKFNNLFEVEGLGEPSGDVPPSTNKIKKDKKTKDGKVELVSVEDELFPKEGNAKEQFREKVIDKINGMIQGTATLEDLLQLVRSKQVKPVKEGFEGAIEILETALDAIEKSDYSDEKKKELRSKLAKANQAEREMADAKAWDDWTKGKRRSNHTSIARHETKNSEGERKTRLRSPNNNYRSGGFSKTKPEWKQVEDSLKRHEKKVANESFEQAINILEEIINEVSVGKLAKAAENSFPAREKEYNDIERKRQENHREGSKTKSKKKIDNLYKELQDILGKGIKANKRYNQAKNIVDLNLPKDSKTSVSKLANSAKKSQIGRGEALSVERNKSGNDFDYGKYERAHKRVHRANDIADIKRSKNEPFAESIKILEEIINEVSVGKLSRALDNSVEKRQKEAQTAREKAENAPKGSNSVLLNAQARKANRRSQDAQVLKSLKLPKDSKVSANKLFKSAEKALPHRENEVTKNSNSSSYSRYRRAWDIADTNPVKYNKSESFEQAIDMIEELIQCLGESKSQEELSSVAKKVLPQREENARKAHDELNKVTDKLSPYNMLNGKFSQRQRETVANALNKAEKADNKVAHAKSYLEKPKEKQQMGMKFDKILCSCEEELNASKEILENLYKGINKKVNKGELSVSDALRLEKKVQDTISPEKRKHDGKELEAEMKSSLEPEIQVNKTLKALRRNDKKNNQGKANYKFTFDYKPVEEAIKILELFDRPDLIDDISKVLTKKTVKQHLEDGAKKLLGLNKTKKLNEVFEGAIEILEQLLSERKYSEEEIREIAKKVRPERVKKFNKACDELDKVTQGKNPDNFTSVQKYRANKAAEKVERAEDRLNHVDDIINPIVKTPTGIKRKSEV